MKIKFVFVVVAALTAGIGLAACTPFGSKEPYWGSVVVFDNGGRSIDRLVNMSFGAEFPSKKTAKNGLPISGQKNTPFEAQLYAFEGNDGPDRVTLHVSGSYVANPGEVLHCSIYRGAPDRLVDDDAVQNLSSYAKLLTVSCLASFSVG